MTTKIRHDLLTPINHLIGYSEMLIEQLQEWDESQASEPVATIHTVAKEALSHIQQVFPPGEDTIGPGLDTLASNLTRNINEILELSDEATSRIELSQHATEIESDLGRLRLGANNLRDILCDLAYLEAAAPPAMSPVEDNGIQVTKPLSAVNDAVRGILLVVDDNDTNRDVLARRLERDGYEVWQAPGGERALEMLSASRFDLVLLDVMMPGLDGFEVLRRLKSKGRLDGLPVIMISAMDEVQSAVRCIELGAEDYLTKPFNSILLRARIGASLEKKRLRDDERLRAEELRLALLKVEEERRRSESLLLNILPAKISQELRSEGKVKPKYFEDVTIVFTDFVGFTLSTENLAADELVEMLDEHFTAFDKIVRSYGLEKLKTTGDSYMFMGGLPPRSPSHPVDALMACMEIAHYVETRRSRSPSSSWEIRIGMHIGPVIAGVVGIEKFAFDVWGETVNYSSRMEASGEPGRINLSERCYSRIKDFFECEARGKVLTKEQRAFEMYFVKGVHPKLMADLSAFPPPLFSRRYQTYFERNPSAFPAYLGLQND